MSRTYDIELSCGCLISLDGGGGLIPCSNEDEKNCKYFEEYLCSQEWISAELECWGRNHIKEPTMKEVKKQTKHLTDIYNKRIEKAKDEGKIESTWAIPFSHVGYGYFVVKAKTKKEAIEKFEKGYPDDFEEVENDGDYNLEEENTYRVD